MPRDDDAPLTDREKLLLRAALVPAFLRRVRTVFQGAIGVNQRVAGLLFDTRGRPVGVTFVLPARSRVPARGLKAG